jgi:hypothetical protein
VRGSTQTSKPSRKPELSCYPKPGINTSEGLITKAYEEDKTPSEIIKDLENGKRYRRDISLAQCDIDKGQLRDDKKLYIPDHEPYAYTFYKAIMITQSEDTKERQNPLN